MGIHTKPHSNFGRQCINFNKPGFSNRANFQGGFQKGRYNRGWKRDCFISANLLYMDYHRNLYISVDIWF
jgi:hypothetical protein